MATQTANLGLALPGYEDAADIRILNQNFEKLDESSARWGLEVNASLSPSGTLELTGGLPAEKDGLTVQFVSPAAATDGLQMKFAGSDTLYPILTTGEGKEPIQAGAWDIGVPVTLTVSGGSCFFKAGAGINDTLPPQVTGFKAVDSSGGGVPKITVSWQNPTAFFAGVLIVRKEGSAPTGVRDGVKVYTGTGTSFVDTNVVFDTTYYYRAYPYNEKKQYQTLTNVVSITPKSWQMPKFTGSGYASGDQKKGMFTCLSSGTLTLDAQTYDVFVVGGGASGKAIPDLEDSYGAAGGGSGYTNTKKGVVYKGGECRVYIGSGGIPIGNDGDTPWCNPGSESSISIGVETVSALGGTVQGYGNGSLYGTNGGSGGGNAGYKTYSAGIGGSDGSDSTPASGWTNNSRVGKGQGTTTRAFEESSQKLYAGGGTGGSGSRYAADGEPGGKGGGGRGGDRNGNGGDGTANTGGGGGGAGGWPVGTNTIGGYGGSGIVIVRWGY